MKKIYISLIFASIFLCVNVHAESKTCKYVLSGDSLAGTYDIELNCKIDGTNVSCDLEVGSKKSTGIKPSGHKAFPGKSIYNYSGDTYFDYLKKHNNECFPQMTVQYKIVTKKNFLSNKVDKYVDEKSFYIDYMSMDGWSKYISTQGENYTNENGPYYYKNSANIVVALAKPVGQNQQSNATCKNTISTATKHINDIINSYSEDTCRDDSVDSSVYYYSAYTKCEEKLNTLKTFYTEGDLTANSCLNNGGISKNDNEYIKYQKASDNAKEFYEKTNGSIECGKKLTNYAYQLDAAIYKSSKVTEVESLLSESQQKKEECLTAGYLNEQSRALEIYENEYNQAMNTFYSNNGNNYTKPSIVYCDLFGEKTFGYIKIIVNILKYMAPILVIVLGMLDFVKVVMTGEEKDMKTAGTKFLKRIIAAIILILLPVLLNFIFGIVGFSEDCLQHLL